MRFSRLVLTAAVVYFALVLPGSAADDALPGVIEKLREQEELYRNIEVWWKTSYHSFAPLHPLSADVLKHRETKGRFVEQDGKFFLSYHGEQETHGGVKQRVDCDRAFDGTMTRLLEDRRGHQVGNIIQGPAFDASLFHVHTVPLQRQAVKVPLSTWISGNAEIQKHPAGKVRRGFDLQASYLGRERYADLDCHVVKVEYVISGGKGTVTDYRLFWLAIERNYLPVRAQAFRARDAKTEPIEETVLNNLHEIEPGKWYPKSATHSVYDSGMIAKDGTRLPSWQDDHVIFKASLSPKHDIDLFRSISFPDGTMVYELADGKTVNSYVSQKTPLEPVSK